MQGENLGYKRMGLSTLVVIAGGELAVAAAELGAGLIGVAGAVVATTRADRVCCSCGSPARHIRGSASRGRSLRTSSGTFFKLSGWFLLWNLVIQLMRASDVVVLGIAASPQHVTVYALSRYVPEAIFGVVAIVDLRGSCPGSAE